MCVFHFEVGGNAVNNRHQFIFDWSCMAKRNVPASGVARILTARDGDEEAKVWKSQRKVVVDLELLGK